jgi:Ca-activated chloride channel homolog
MHILHGLLTTRLLSHLSIFRNPLNLKEPKAGKPIEECPSVIRRAVIAMGMSLALAATGLAAPTSSLQAQDGQPTFRSSVELVTVTVAVRDDRGRVIKGMKKADFEVFDTGSLVPIKDFYAGDAPVSLAVLLDVSGSMTMGGNIDRAREAVLMAMQNLRRGSDEAALFTFDSQLQEVVRFTKDLDRIHRVSLEGKPWGTTLLYDAIAQTAELVAVRANRHRALLVITDGVDSGSKLTPPQVSAVASEIDVPVYLLTVVNPLDHPGTEFAVSDGDETTQTATLADLARWTGGDMRIASVPAHTVEAIRDLFTELRHQYLITFEPGTRQGWHPLEIRARKKNLIIHARSGYVIGPSRRTGT